MATTLSTEPVAHKPYVPDEANIPEFTWPAVLSGTLLGLVFGASSLYLVLRVGMTVSASIPVAVLSITLFRALSRVFGIRPATILENNITQTAGSAGESIAFGVGVTMPALMLLGFDMDLTRIMVVSVLGGLLGILMMIPLRRAFIVRMHGKPGEPGTLLYPEGTACAQVLISGEQGGTSGKTVFVGFGLAFAAKFVYEGMSFLEVTLKWPMKFFSRVATITSDMAPELLGVGYVIGMRISSIMMAGAVIGNLVIVPAIAFFGDSAPAIIPPGETPVAKMDLGKIQENYLRFIGAGCVTAAGIISMVRTLPLIVRSILAGMGKLSGAGGAAGVRRTERDMPMSVVLLGSLALLVGLALFLYHDLTGAGDAEALQKAVLGAGLVLLFGFLFVMVSSRLTGEIGSSSNPISGMTVATLSLTCVIFLYLGMTSPAESVLALSIAGVVCIAASNGGTTSQDLKTGFLVGGTPYKQQYAILIGAVTSALVIGGTLLLFNQAGTVVSKKAAPNVTLPPAQVAQLTGRVNYEGQEYRVWWARSGEMPGVPTGKYYVNDAGKVVALEDPAITGRIKERDDGSEVKMKFPAPKTQVMGIIINGVLSQKLNWGLVLIGAMLAVGLELCGVSSLAFAVGVYIPMNYTAPIFLGGILRYVVDAAQRKPAAAAIPGEVREATEPSPEAEAEVAAIAETETSPGVLLSSGYIAGGSLAGVLIAFLEFPVFKSIKDAVNFSKSAAPEYWSAVVFGGLMLFLLLVGLGVFLKPPAASTGSTNGVEEEGMQ